MLNNNDFTRDFDNNGAATAAPTAPTSSAMFAEGSAAWAKARTDEIAKTNINIIAPDIPKNATETMIADAYAEAFFDIYPATLPELMTKQTAKAYFGLLTDMILTHMVMENTLRGKAGLAKLNTKPAYFAGMIMMHAILSTSEVRMIHEEDDAAKCRFAIREWIPDKHGGPGHYTGVWTPFEFGGNMTAIKLIMDNMLTGMSVAQKRDAFSTMETTFKARVPIGYATAEKWDWRLIPCYNGVVEGYPDGRPVTFTPWDDVDTINERYSNWCPLYRLGIDYNPDAQCPAYLPPDDYLASLFPDDELGQAEVRLMWYVMQFGIREYAGKGGYCVLLINSDNGSRGRNGKSSLLDILRNLFEFVKKNSKICTKQFSECFSGFDSACLVDAVLHISYEDNGNITGAGVMKSYIRYDPITVRRKNMKDIEIQCHCQKISARNSTLKFNKKNMSLADMNRFVTFKMEKNFETGSPDYNPNIGEYTKRQDWLEYFLLRLTQLPFVNDYDLDDLNIVDVNRQEMIDDNMPTQGIIDELLDSIGVSTVPTSILYPLYVNWAKNNGQYDISQIQFTKDCEIYCTEHPGKWRIEKCNSGRPLRAAELAEYAAVKDCDALLDYAMPETQFAAKNGLGYSRPEVTGAFDVNFLRRKKYKSFLVRV